MDSPKQRKAKQLDISTKVNNVGLLHADRTGTCLGTDTTISTYDFMNLIIKNRSAQLKIEVVTISLWLSIMCSLSMDLCIVHKVSRYGQ